MGTTLHVPHPWPHITAALRGPGPRRVAIAYLDTTAPELLPLRAGDQLIVNAARPAVRAHATSPTALARFLDAGVRVLSTPNLHTGLIVTGDRVIVGPASAPPEAPTERDLAWFFKLFSLRGQRDGVEQMCFFTYLQKTDDTFDFD